MMSGPNLAKWGTTRQVFRAMAVRVHLIALVIWSLQPGSLYSAGVGPKELFELAGIGAEQLAEFHDGEPWQASDNQILRRMLYRIQRDVRPADLEGWSLGEADPEHLADDPKAYRMQVFELRGRVVLAEPYRLSEAENEAGDFASIWRCRMLLEDDERPIDVFTARLPEAWSVGKPIDEPAGALAFFLKTSETDATGPRAFFLTNRMAWYPPTSLGRLGMDVALLDDVPLEAPPRLNPDGSTPEVDWSTRQLTERDHESFYQMLNAVGSAEDGQLSRWAEAELAAEGESSFSIVPLFNQPETQQGRLVELMGVARRIIPIRVGEAEVRERFGIKEYYQVYLFTDDSQDNPVVFCLRELPEGLPLGDGAGFGEQLRVPGFFYKTWSYPTSAASTDGKTQRQLAPLLIGKSAVWYPAQAPSDLSPTMRMVGTALLILVLGSFGGSFVDLGEAIESSNDGCDVGGHRRCPRRTGRLSIRLRMGTRPRAVGFPVRGLWPRFFATFCKSGQRVVSASDDAPS